MNPSGPRKLVENVKGYFPSSDVRPHIIEREAGSPLGQLLLNVPWEKGFRRLAFVAQADYFGPILDVPKNPFHRCVVLTRHEIVKVCSLNDFYVLDPREKVD